MEVCHSTVGLTRRRAPRRDFCDNSVVDRGIALRQHLGISQPLTASTLVHGLRPNIPYVAAPLLLLLLLLPPPLLLLPTSTTNSPSNSPPRYQFTLSCIAELDGELRESPPSLMSEPIELPSEADEEWGITDILDKVFSPGTAASSAPGAAPPEKTAAATPSVPSPRERDRRGGAGAGTAGGAEGSVRSAARRRRPPPPPGDECVVS